MKPFAAPLIVVWMALVSCGGGGGAEPAAPQGQAATYLVGGNVTGLLGSELTLRNNGADALIVRANERFSFATKLADGAAYDVTIASQPTGQVCMVANGKGIVRAADVSDIAVACASSAPSPEPPALSVELKQPRVLRFTWSDVANETEYRLIEISISTSTRRLLTTIGSNATSHELVASAIEMASAMYLLQACTPSLCVDSNVVTVAGSLAASIERIPGVVADDSSGYSVALSRDGRTLAVGAPNKDAAQFGLILEGGAVYVYVRTVAGWTFDGVLKGSNTGPSDAFGRRVALSADGSTLVVAAPFEDSNARGVDGQTNELAPNSGAVYVYGRTAGIWRQQAYLKASNSIAGLEFGSSLAVSDSGSVLAVGARNEFSDATGVNGDQNNTRAAGSGAVYIFDRAGGGWAQTAYVKASHTRMNAEFGGAVALSATGSILAVGAPGDSPPGVSGVGAAYVYSREGGNWALQASLQAPNADPGDAFGFSIAISGDGMTLAVGAPIEASSSTGVDGNPGNNAAGRSGAVYVFARSGANWTSQAYVKASNAEAGDQFGYSVALSTDGAYLLASAPFEKGAGTGLNADQRNNSLGDAGAAYVFRRSGLSWSQRAYLKSTNTRASDVFGLSVALSGDGETSAIGSPADDGLDGLLKQGGAVYIY